ncbi:MAG: 3-isopropylmalate dehydratase small subunit LeuD [Candidatus Methanohalarchaeum thermophilum]|uniref:3-isopropylmalate dehydratase small subunit n=1 Tax=Methanohalarchaeum thermophilum TaxID=1903181 RepID=A0A1Q6DW73_METT1|nr:MAG: 3-isopropylmalate dehydratase small subunit LeuD [Candidatus Methanohalarchaeum thermophilum]
MNFKGNVWKFGDDVSTDAIIPGKYKFDTLDMDKLARHTMEGIDPNFYDKIEEGDLIVSGKNFGCGSSREQAPLVIKHSGISCVLAEGFSRIFYRNSINVGLPILEVPGISDKVEEGDNLSVDIEEGKIVNLTKDEEYKAEPLPDSMLEVLLSGGLSNYIKKHGGFEWDTK